MGRENSQVSRRDATYFQEECERLVFLHEAAEECCQLVKELCQRLEHMDELAESIDFERSGGDVQHYYADFSVPRMQMCLGKSVGSVRIAIRRLEPAARKLQRAAQRTHRSGRLEQIARGYLALAAEATRVVDTHHPWCEFVQVNWTRVDAIRRAIRWLEDREAYELREDVEKDLDRIENYRQRMIAIGMGDYIRQHVDGNSRLQRALAGLRQYIKYIDGLQMGADPTKSRHRMAWNRQKASL